MDPLAKVESGTPLSNEEISVLSNGLSFCPTNNANPFKLNVDTFKFFHYVQLNYFIDTLYSTLMVSQNT